MNLGLGNLRELKAQLLNESLRAQTTYDDDIASIGKGVAASFDKFCNRGLARIENVVDQFTSDRNHWVLNRYPVEEIASVETKANDNDGWISQTDAIENSMHSSGWIRLRAASDSYEELTRVTYTGGYWFDDTENEPEYVTGEDGDHLVTEGSEGDPELVTTIPDGATAVPEELKYAWYTQCKHAWDMRDNLGLGMGEKPEMRSKLAQLELVPIVGSILGGFIRYQIT